MSILKNAGRNVVEFSEDNVKSDLCKSGRSDSLGMRSKNCTPQRNFERCSKLCELYLEIAKTYYEISKEDHISRLAEEQRKTADAKGKETRRIT